MRAVLRLARFLLSLRYRIEVDGLETLTSERLNRKAGTIFLPNHPAELDPVMLMTILWKKFRPRPLVVDHFYFMKGLGFFMKIVNALPLPNMVASNNKWKLKEIEELLNNILEKLKNGESFLIYPSGRLKLTGLEAIGGASLVHTLLKACPDANVVLIRTTGLWGSLFSRALTGKIPPFAKTLFKGFLILLKNGIFFAPRRKVHIHIEPAPQDFPFHGERLEMNQYLEQWYNRYPDPGPEPLTLVSQYFWKERYPKVEVSSEVEKKAAPVSPEIEQLVFAELSKLSHRPVEQINRQMHLSFDLGLDSLDVTQLYIFLEEHCNVHNLQHGELQTVDDLVKAASGFSVEQEVIEKLQIPAKWKRIRSSRPKPFEPLGHTLQEAFLICAGKLGKETACGDESSGVLSYSKIKTAALVLAERIHTFPGEHIGVMLPASVGVNVIILACLLAGKIPVMMNWTVGTKALDHAVKLIGLKTVLSSYRFVSSLETGELGSVEELLVFMEKLKKSLTFKEKITGLFSSLKKPESILRKLNIDHIKEDDTAVILFTSGTEAMPKAVPLTHKNLLSNQRSALSCVDFKSHDILFGVLPSFHSFGFSITGIMPLISGLKVFYAPDPTDSRGLANLISQWKPTIFICAPSFIKALFKIAKPMELKSIKLFVSGAEKTPNELFEYVERFGQGYEMIEGYGITECGPIVTLNRPRTPRQGVGQPIPGVELCIIDRETGRTIPKEKEGEICIRGPNVFKGYLGSQASPFIQIDENMWYRSGDRGYLGEGNHLFLSGRLKRFIKVGGEMVSLGGLEEEIGSIAAKKHWIKIPQEGPSLAIAAKDIKDDRPLIILYTTFPVNKEELNSLLQESGYGRIVKISEIRQLEQIPVTGTGKTNYRLLDEM
ncbi:MAG TPA: AMP-binding protein [Rhabdochlamydiaceae bacterium]|nr:AMP-binding protein [Rhabdochlamydiaceae bacterium]